MQQYRENVNIVSTNLKKIDKQVIIEDYQKKYKIRDNRSVSPYGNNQHQAKKKNFSNNNHAMKTFTGRFYNF